MHSITPERKISSYRRTFKKALERAGVERGNFSNRINLIKDGFQKLPDTYTKLFTRKTVVCQVEEIVGGKSRKLLLAGNNMRVFAESGRRRTLIEAIMIPFFQAVY